MKRAAITAWAFFVLLLGGAAAASVPSPPIVAHDVHISFDLPAHRIEIRDTLLVPVGADSLQLNGALVPVAMSWVGEDGQDAIIQIDAAQSEQGQPVVWPLPASPARVPNQDGLRRLTCEYAGSFFEPVDDVSFSRENVGGEITATISEEGVYLSAAARWLPTFAGTMATHRLTIDTPPGWQPVTQGVRTSQEQQNGRLITVWEAEHPSDGLNLIVNRYVITADKADNAARTEICTYLLEEDPRLSDLYLERTRVYLTMYEQMIGPYPYAKFATVENWFPTGYGMPSYTLLGGAVMRLPFIPYTSFGHEICHNWWGNSVFVAKEGGNWCEGLTSYCADYHFKTQESPEAAREYRRNLLKDYVAYVGDGKDFPLSEFVSRHSGATRAVGYGKSMMVFHMIDRMIGRDAFLAALQQVYRLKRFQLASWSDFLAAFAAAGQRDLSAVPAQWLERAGAPVLRLESAQRRNDRVRVTIAQDAPTYDLQVPVVVTGKDGVTEHLVTLSKMSQSFEIEAPGAVAVAIDPDYHLFRRLHPVEIEPTISQVLAEEVPLYILPAADEAQVAGARAFVTEFADSDMPDIFENGQMPVDIRPGEGRSGIILNPDLAAMKPWLTDQVSVAGDLVFLAGKRYSLEDYDLVLTAINPHDPTTTDMIILCRSPQRLPSLASRVGHYGKYSWLLLPAGQGPVLKGNFEPAASPLAARLAP